MARDGRPEGDCRSGAGDTQGDTYGLEQRDAVPEGHGGTQALAGQAREGGTACLSGDLLREEAWYLCRVL